MDFSALEDSLVMRGRLAAAPDVPWAETAVTDAYELDLPDGGRLSVDVMRRPKAPVVRVRALRGGNGRAPGTVGDVAERLYTGYSKKAEAVEDAYRALISAAIGRHFPDGRSPLDRWAGWMADVVLLLRGSTGSCLVYRVHESGKVSSIGSSDLYYSAMGAFADGVDQLADDLHDRADDLEEGDADDLQRAGLLRSVVVPWLMREAAQARLDVARQQFYWGVQGTSGYIGIGLHSTITMSALARGLYTDRSNLHRVIRSSQSSRQASNQLVLSPLKGGVPWLPRRKTRNGVVAPKRSPSEPSGLSVTRRWSRNAQVTPAMSSGPGTLTARTRSRCLPRSSRQFASRQRASGRSSGATWVPTTRSSSTRMPTSLSPCRRSGTTSCSGRWRRTSRILSCGPSLLPGLTSATS